MPGDLRGRDGEAVVMRRYGPPVVLGLERVALQALLPDEIRVRSIASTVNHSDLEIRAGNWPIRRADPFPYVPGLEVLGDVVETGAAVEEFPILGLFRQVAISPGLRADRVCHPCDGIL
jgi:NADPH:quinone reductase-like Zn-dependent oxidoreductase